MRMALPFNQHAHNQLGPQTSTHSGRIHFPFILLSCQSIHAGTVDDKQSAVLPQ